MQLSDDMKSNIKEVIFNNMEACGCCGSYHPMDTYHDCRNDDYRYHPDDMSQLLIAATDLLEALQGLFEHCCMIHKHWGDNSNNREANNAIKAALSAIAKATE